MYSPDGTTTFYKQHLSRTNLGLMQLVFAAVHMHWDRLCNNNSICANLMSVKVLLALVFVEILRVSVR